MEAPAHREPTLLVNLGPRNPQRTPKRTQANPPNPPLNGQQRLNLPKQGDEMTIWFYEAILNKILRFVKELIAKL